MQCMWTFFLRTHIYMGRRFEKDGVGHNGCCTLLFMTRQIDKIDIGHGKFGMIFHFHFH